VERLDVLIVGGGPAGSSCAWRLARAGLDVAVIDRQGFPRDKVCAGWITPQVLRELDIDPATYRDGRTFQPFHGFRIGVDGGAQTAVDHGSAVSFGIRRCEFDDYLLRRSGARLALGRPLRSLERRDGEWIANEALRAPVIVGAGGHFCPVARRLAGDGAGDPIVAAQEIEFPLDEDGEKECAVLPELPELFFSADLRGYGWVVRKGRFVNVGLGRQDTDAFPGHLEAFLRSLAARGRLPHGMPRRLHGHAYRVYDQPRRALVADGALLVGDAAGLADPHSGEGIRPAVESGLLAARTLLAAEGRYERDRLVPYERAVRTRFASAASGAAAAVSALLPMRARASLARWLLGQAWFARRVVVDDWFLHRELPALPS